MNAVRFIRFVGLSNAPQYFLALTKICGTEKVLKVLESVLKSWHHMAVQSSYC